MTDFPPCEVCNKPGIGVCSSTLGPISHSFCRECLNAGRQPWNTLVGGLFGLTKDTVADWIYPIIEETCKFYNKTEDELWREVDNLEEQFSKEFGV